MLVAYVSSPVVRIHRGSTDFSRFLYLDSSVISLKSAFTSTFFKIFSKNSEYDQEIPQSQTADNPVAPRGRAAQPSRDTRKTN